MIDIAINNSGDFILGKKPCASRLSLSWKSGAYDSLRLSFKTGKNMNDPRESTGLCLEFTTSNITPQLACQSTHDAEELKQRILVLLRTERGELVGQRSYGAELNQKRHQDITNAEVVRAVEDIVLAAVEPLLNEPRVAVEKRLSDGVFRSQNINVYIYDGKKEIYHFSMGDM
jgi:gene 25-like lysozyme